MAEIWIQRKKPVPSPWLLVALAMLLLGAGAYFFLRPDMADEVAPTAATTESPADSLLPGSPAALARATPPPADGATPDTAPVASPGRAALLDLVPQLTALADQPALRDAATVREQRDNLTSATDRLTTGDAQASLRPGLVATANFLRAVQQQAAPALVEPADALARQAGQLSGHDGTLAEQAQNQEYLGQAALLLRQLEDAINR